MSDNETIALWTMSDDQRVSHADETHFKDAGQKVHYGRGGINNQGHVQDPDARTDEHPILAGAIILSMAVSLGLTLRDNPNTGSMPADNGKNIKMEMPIVRQADKPSTNPVVQKFRTVVVDGVATQREYWEMQNPNAMSDRQLRELQAYNARNKQ